MAGTMGSVIPRFDRRAAEERFKDLYRTIQGDKCVYCGMATDGKYNHQPPLNVLQRFATEWLDKNDAILEHFGECKLVPSCSICKIALGSYHGRDDNARRHEIAKWFRVNGQYPDDALVVEVGRQLINKRHMGNAGKEIYQYSGVGRVIYVEALDGFVNGRFSGPADFPEWLQLTQSELAEWLRGAPRRVPHYFLDMANLTSCDPRPQARNDPVGIKISKVQRRSGCSRRTYSQHW